MLKYILGIPVFGALYLFACFLFFALVFFLGDTGVSPQGPLGVAASIGFAVLKFPFGYLTYVQGPLGRWFEEPITHNGIIGRSEVFNAIVWGAAITWATGFFRRRRKGRAS
jgi:hypothetical protein